MSNSQTRTKRSLSIWQFTLLLSIAYLFGLVISHNATVMETVYWSGYELESLNDQGEWVKGDRFNIGSGKRIQELKFDVTIDDSEKWRRPIGLMLGGPFSAEVFWNDELLGSKGEVGQSAEQEVPGPIDTVLFVPSRLLEPGNHQIRMRLSTQHLIGNDASVFHFVWLTPYRDSGRRDLRYYATPLIILSALLVLSFQSFRIGHNAGNPLHSGLGVFGFSVVVLLLAEISRAIVNYPYHFHEVRGFMVWLGNAAAGLSLIYIGFKLTKSRLHKGILYVGLLSLLLTYFIPMKSGDMKLALQFIVLASAPALVFAMLLIKKQVSYLSTLPLFCVACIISNSMDTGLFLDSFQFVAALVLIGGAWAWVYVDIKEQQPEQSEPDGISAFWLKSPGGDKSIPVADCVALKGEGNYTTLMLKDGQTELHQDGIGAIMESMPIGFVRVHKSYAVNMTLATHLRSATGSKYWLEMSNNEKIPVSRYRVAEVRSYLET